MASLIDKMIGHKEQRQWLVEQAQADRLPSSIIFHGPDGVGKKTLARALLQIMNCQQSKMACGTCSHCVRALEDRNELVYELRPESKKNISVDQVRELHSFFNLKSMHAARFVIIDPAEKLSTAAANALLKVLEEAPENTWFILVTEQMRSLLATIRSRSHILQFQSLSEVELLEHSEFDSVSLSWADGRLHLALELQEPERVEQLNESLQFLYSLVCEQPQDWKKKASWFFSDDEQRNFCMDVWKQAFEKRLYGLGEDLDWLPSSTGTISQLYEDFELLKRDISLNVDKLLAVENFHYKAHRGAEK